MSDRVGGIGEVAALSFPMAVWGHGLSVSVLPGGIAGTAKMARSRL